MNETLGEQQQTSTIDFSIGNLLFLDFDGVINNYNWIYSHSERGFDHIDPSRVEIVNVICALLNCDVVISSTWRILHRLTDIRAGLKDKGALFTKRIIGVTDRIGSSRGEQIARFCQKYPNKKIVILDDEVSDMKLMLPFVVRTNSETGIVESDIERALKVINGQ